MEESSNYIELISGRRSGPCAVLKRGGLSVFARAYGAVLKVRNGYYDNWKLPAWLGVPVISVGNLTVGGTGKTPMAIWVCRQLLERGRKPAVLSRGYKASREGLADELLMVSRQCPEAVAVANPNRLAAGQLAIEQYGIDSAVLDDGFQHRRLARDLDIVLIDATRPFGFGHILPRGLLREPIDSLERVSAVVITRADLGTSAVFAEIESTVKRFNIDAPIVRAVHRPAGFTDLEGNPVDAPTGDCLGCMAGIARPEALVKTLNQMGYSPVQKLWWPDHHVYSPENVEMMSRWIEETGVDAVMTTEKDAVKLARLAKDLPVSVLALRIEIEMLDDGGKIIGDMIDTVLNEYEQDKPSKVTEDNHEPNPARE